MGTVDRRNVMTGLLAAGALGLASGWTHSAVAASARRPWTIPALREWRPGAGSFRLVDRPVIVVGPGDAPVLSDAAHVFTDDLRRQFGVAPQVVVRTGEPGDAELALRLGASDPRIGEQGYVLDVGRAVVVTARESAGAFYGTRSVLQLLTGDRRIPAGRAVDWPHHAERGLMIDLGRKAFTMDWLRERVHELAYLKLNVLHLHLTDDLGWRIESDLGLHSAQHLSKAQIAELVALAARHHITVVPEIDLPGHMRWALRHEPYARYRLRSPFAEKDNALDYTSADSRRFVHELLDEYLPLFPGPYWHTGADEFLSLIEYPLYPQLTAYGSGHPKDGFLAFVNEINDHVRAAGKTLRVWNDALGGGRRTALDPDVVVEWWTDVSPLGDLFLVPTPGELLDRGHRVLNASWYPTYYTNLPSPIPPRPTPRAMYENWQTHRFRGPVYLNDHLATPYHDVASGAPTGAKLHVWNDDPTAETPAQIANGIHDRLRVIAQQTWDTVPPSASYDEFLQVIGAIGDGPGSRR